MECDADRLDGELTNLERRFDDDLLSLEREVEGLRALVEKLSERVEALEEGPMSTSDHSIIFDRMGATSTARWDCRAEDTAPCRVVYDCRCEEVPGFKIIDGVPTHAIYDDFGPDPNAILDRHAGHFVPDHCVFADWFEEQDECVRGEVIISVEPEWDHSAVTFTVAAASIGEEGRR